MAHAITLRSQSRTIGAVHTFAPSLRRTVDAEYEVEANSTGMPVDLVPQLVDGREIRLSRYDLYPLIMEEVFGAFELVLLTDQTRPFTLREIWRGPGINALGGTTGAALGNISGLGNQLGLPEVAPFIGGIQGSISDAVATATASRVGAPIVGVLGILTEDVRAYEYRGCWFTDVGRQIDAKSDRVISVDATLVFQDRVRVL
jgi:hypothetical protein